MVEKYSSASSRERAAAYCAICAAMSAESVPSNFWIELASHFSSEGAAIPTPGYRLLLPAGTVVACATPRKDAQL